MASTTAEREAVLSASLLELLQDTTRGLESVDIDSAIASALRTTRYTAAMFAPNHNRARNLARWGGLPVELQLVIARLLPLADRTRMLWVSSDIRALLLSDTALWTTIPHVKALSRHSDRLEYLDTLVARAGTRPLELEWRHWCLPEYKRLAPTDPDAMFNSYRHRPARRPFVRCQDPVRDAVFSIIPRVRALEIDSSYLALSTFWTGTAPLLETLTVTDRHREPLGEAHLKRRVWTGAAVPQLRKLRLGDMQFDGQPKLRPFESVVYLEGHMDEKWSRWQHLWSWFPRLVHLDASVRTSTPLPPPPESLRIVRLRTDSCETDSFETDSCQDPAKVVSTWGTTHNVRLLEIETSTSFVLRSSVSFLAAADPGPWDVSFSDDPPRAVLRGAHAAVVVRGVAMADTVAAERSNAEFLDHVHALTLAGPRIAAAVFRHRLHFRSLRSLTLALLEPPVRDMQPAGEDSLFAPALEELVVDLAGIRAEEELLSHLPGFVAHIKHDERLRELVVRLSESFDQHSPLAAAALGQLAPVAHVVRVEHCPRFRFLDDAPILSEYAALQLG